MSEISFKTAHTCISSLIHSINLLGDNLIGVEVGVFKAESSCTILQNCPNVKILHLVDNWKPYNDYLKDPYDGRVAYIVDQENIDIIKFMAYNNIKYSGHKDKVTIHEGQSSEIAKTFEEEYFDFVFLDTYMTYHQAKGDLFDWYPKVKKGGIFSGHDWNVSVIKNVVTKFRQDHNITSNMGVYDNIWAWIKQ